MPQERDYKGARRNNATGVAQNGTRWGKDLSQAILYPQQESATETHQAFLLPPDSLASLSVLPGSEEAIQMTVTSGLRHSRLLKPSNPPGYCLRMLLESSRWRSTLCYLTWKVRATPGRRLLFQLAPSTPRTDETESGLWPTAIANDTGRTPEQYSKHQAAISSLACAVKMLPTPKEWDWKGQTQRGIHAEDDSLTPKQEEGLTHEITESRKGWTNFANLKEQAVYGKKMWPTPQTGSHNEAAHNAMSGDWKTKFCEVAQIPTTGQLNPNWVEWLMGFPVGWTDLSASETPSCHK